MIEEGEGRTDGQTDHGDGESVTVAVAVQVAGRKEGKEGGTVRFRLFVCVSVSVCKRSSLVAS